MNWTATTCAALALVSAAGLAFSQEEETPKPIPRQALEPPPKELPRWMRDPRLGEIYPRRGRYNFDVYRIEPLARDLNAIAVGHSMVYEAIVTGGAERLETQTYAIVDRVLRHPPKLMPAERSISPTFGRKYAFLEKVFDWTHVLHAQTVDVLASPRMTHAEKDAEIEALWNFYFDSVPYAITPLPMNMEYLDAQSYSGAFRKRYPKVNGLFWGYHWLQGAMYDMLYGATPLEQRLQYEVVGEQYRTVELYRTDRDFMPMFADTSPQFARRFPKIANAFDNLHMLHDLVNDILADPTLGELERDRQIQRAVWMILASTHAHESPMERDPHNALHDHRHFEGLPGMGMMKMSTPELMYMQGFGWMNLTECAHCSVRLPEDWSEGVGATVSAQGWTMNVRCVLCARDMAAETPGRAILRIATEDPTQILILISDEEGHWSSVRKDPVFLEVEGSHADCSDWSRAFTSRAAFDAYLKANADNPDLKGAKPLTLEEWSEREGKKPDTYARPKGPVPNPYRIEEGEAR